MLKKLFEPNKVIGFIIFNLSFGLLIYVFACHLEETFLAYVSYLLSAYSLVMFIIWFVKVCKFGNNYVKENSKVYKTYKNNSKSIIKISLIFSMFINFIYGIFKFISGIYYNSFWFITFAVYYLLLCFMRVSLILSVRKKEIGSDLLSEYKKLKHTGIILLCLDIVLSGMIILIINKNQVITYPGYLIYIVAMYDFYLIISAFVDVIRYRKNQSPVLLSSKCINLTVAMVSMISLEVAMLYEFGNNDSDFKLVMISCTGFFVCLFNSLMAIFMIVKGNLKMKKMSNLKK